jgi:ADP-heptose:LPS heptosyltransferase
VPPGRGLAIHPGSGGRAKRWPLARFLALARAAPSSLGRAPLFLLGPVEADADPGLAAAVAAAGFPSVLEPPLPLLAALAAEAGLFLGNDGGPAHLAAAAGAPTLALFGPSSAAVWAPRGPRAETLRAPRGDLGALLERTVLEALARLA